MKSISLGTSILTFNACIAMAQSVRYELITTAPSRLNKDYDQVTAYRFDHELHQLRKCEVLMPRSSPRKFQGDCNTIVPPNEQLGAKPIPDSNNVKTFPTPPYPASPGISVGFWQIDQANGRTQYCELEALTVCIEVTP
jgi:hypothetical protein